MRYCIIDAIDADLIDFDQIRETSVETLRMSNDQSKTFVKFDGEIPTSVEALEYEGPYTHEEMVQILSGPEWST